MRAKLSYIVILLASFSFFVFYRGVLSYIVLITALVTIPIVAIVSFFSMCKLSITLSPQNYSAEQGGFILTAKNSGLFPIGRLVVDVIMEHNFVGKSSTQTLYIQCPAKSTQGAQIKFDMPLCGMITAKIASVKIYDYLGLTSHRKKIDAQANFMKFPVRYPLGDEKSSGMREMDSETYSKRKSGDDPSEIFEIREFRDGDRQNRIHWKLSSKQDVLMVRDFSLPLTEQTIILLECELGKDTDIVAQMNTIFDVAASLSEYLTTKDHAHSIGWVDRQGEFRYFKVQNDELNVIFGEIFYTGVMTEKAICGESFLSSEIASEFSHAVYLGNLSGFKSEVAVKVTGMIVENYSEELKTTLENRYNNSDTDVYLIDPKEYSLKLQDIEL